MLVIIVTKWTVYVEKENGDQLMMPKEELVQNGISEFH